MSLPTYGEITRWLGDGWEVCWHTWQVCWNVDTGFRPWFDLFGNALGADNGVSCYLERKSDGQRVLVRAPGPDEMPSALWVPWFRGIKGGLRESGATRLYATNVTWLDKPAEKCAAPDSSRPCEGCGKYLWHDLRQECAGCGITAKQLAARQSDVVTLGECEVGTWVTLASYPGLESPLVGERRYVREHMDDGYTWATRAEDDWYSAHDALCPEWKVRRLPKEQTTVRGSRDGNAALARLLTAISGGPRDSAAQDSNRWFDAPASQHAALEATLAEQVRTGGHDTEYARRQIVNRAKLRAAMTETPSPRLSRSELPDEQRALVKRWGWR